MSPKERARCWRPLGFFGFCLFVCLFLFFIFLTSLLEYNCFTMVYQFLLYNKVNQLYIYIYPHISSLLHLPPSDPPCPTPLGGHRALRLSPCAIWLLPTSYLFYIWQCIYVHATLSLCPSLPFPFPVSSSPFSSRSASLFPSCPQVLHYLFYFFRFHIYVLAYSIYFSLSDLPHYV